MIMLGGRVLLLFDGRGELLVRRWKRTWELSLQIHETWNCTYHQSQLTTTLFGLWLLLLNLPARIEVTLKLLECLLRSGSL